MKGVIFIDLDETIIRGQSQKFFLLYLLKKGLIGVFFYARLLSWFVLYKLGLINNPQKVMNYAFSFLCGKSCSEVENLSEDFVETILFHKVYPQARDLINKHKLEGHTIVLVTNAAEFIVSYLAKKLGVDHYISTELSVVNGIYTGDIKRFMYGDYKSTAVLEYIKNNKLDNVQTWGYGDDISDVSMLNSVSFPCAVNPSNKLKKVAMNMNWPILYMS